MNGNQLNCLHDELCRFYAPSTGRSVAKYMLRGAATLSYFRQKVTFWSRLGENVFLMTCVIHFNGVFKECKDEHN